MALARLALRNLQQKLSNSTLQASNPSNYLLFRNINGNIRGSGCGSVFEKQGLIGSSYGLLNRFTTGTMPLQSVDKKPESGKEVAVQTKKGRRKWRSLLPFSRRQRKRSLWRDDDDYPRGTTDLLPSINALFPSNLSNALLEAAENMNKLFENITPSDRLLGRVKETDGYYKLRYDVPGLSKQDIKITVDDGVLNIKGQHKEEATAGDETDDDEYWSVKNYGYYNTSLMLPDDAKQDDIKAELKDGVLTILVPKTETQGRDVKEVEIQ